MHVPGAKVKGRETGANLLNLAVWSLREQGLIEVEQLRPVESERVVVMGGRSFTRVRPLPGEALKLGGLEGVLLTKLRTRKPGEGLADRIVGALSDDDDWGVRGSLLELDLNSREPWATPAALCFGEAKSAGLLDVRGRLWRREIVVTDPDGVRALEPRDAEIVAARTRYRDREPELDGAVISDCFAALDWAHDPSPD